MEEDDILAKLDSIFTGKPLPKPKTPPPAPAGSSPYDDLFEKHGAAENVDPNLLRAMTNQESNFNPKARSNKNAQGLMQIIPETASRFGVKDVWDPEQNIQGGAKYMRWLLDRFDGDVNLALAGYNAGEGAVEKYGRKIPPYKETQDYVKKITRNYQGPGYFRSGAAPTSDILSRLDSILGTKPEPSTDILGKLDKIFTGTSLEPTNPNNAYELIDPGVGIIPKSPLDRGVPTLSQSEVSVAEESPKKLDLTSGGNPRLGPPPPPSPKATKPVPLEDDGYSVSVSTNPEDNRVINPEAGDITEAGVQVKMAPRVLGKSSDDLGRMVANVTVDLRGVQGNRGDHAIRKAYESVAGQYDLTPEDINKAVALNRGRWVNPPTDKTESGEVAITLEDIALIKGREEVLRDEAVNQAQASSALRELPPQELMTPELMERLDASTALLNATGNPYTDGLKNLGAGALGSGSRIWRSLAGVIEGATPANMLGLDPDRPVKAYQTDNVAKAMMEIAAAGEKPGQKLIGDGDLGAEVLQLAGGLPGDLSRIMLISRLPGGIVSGMSADMATQSLGRGEGYDKAGWEAKKGAIFGGIARFAGPIGQRWAKNLNELGAGSAVSRAGGSAATMAFTGAGTYPTSRYFGADPKTALKETIFNTVFAMADAAPVLAGKTVRAKDSAGNEVTVKIDEQGDVQEIELPKDQPADLELVDTEAAGRRAEYINQQYQASDLLFKEMMRPRLDRLSEANMTIKEGAVEANPAAISILNEVLAKASEKSAKPYDPYNEGFHGIPVRKDVARYFVNALENLRDEALDAGRTEEGIKLNDFLVMFEEILDPEHGDAAIYTKYKDLPEITEGTRVEELAHQQNRRFGVRDALDEAAWEDTPAILSVLSKLRKEYNSQTAAAQMDEVIAQSFRPDAENHLGVSKRDLRAARRELFKKLEQTEGVDEFAYAQSFEGISKAGDVFARYGRIKRRQEDRSEAGSNARVLTKSIGEADAAGEIEGIPAVRGVQDEGRVSSGDSGRLDGRDLRERVGTDEGRIQESVRAEIGVGDFVSRDGRLNNAWIVNKINSDGTLSVRDASNPSSGTDLTVPSKDVKISYKAQTSESSSPDFVDEVEIVDRDTLNKVFNFSSIPNARTWHGSRHRFTPEILVRNKRSGKEEYLASKDIQNFPIGTRVSRRGDGDLIVRHTDGRREIIKQDDLLPEVPEGYEVVRKLPLGRVRDDKIGSGEGAQAYGYGHYTAESKDIANFYREAGAEPVQYFYKGRPFSLDEPVDPFTQAARTVFDTILTYDLPPSDAIPAAVSSTSDVIAQLKQAALEMKGNEKASHLEEGVNKLNAELSALRELDPDDFKVVVNDEHPGYLYRAKVNVPDKNILRLDEQIGSHPKPTRDALTKILGPTKRFAFQTGEDAYSAITSLTGSAKEASSLLKDYGVRGLRFPDRPSRDPSSANTTRSYNYVAFAGDDIDITRIEFSKAFKDHKIFDKRAQEEAMQFTDEMFPNLASLWKRPSSGTRPVVNPNTVAAERTRASRGIGRESLLSDIADKAVKVYREFKRQFKEIDPNESIQMARAADSFRLLSSLNGWARVQAANDVARITQNLSREQYEVFENVLVLRDKQQAVQQGLTPGHGYKDLTDVENSLKVYEHAAAADPEITKALTDREDLRTRIVKDLVDIGMLGEGALKNTRYFHRQVPHGENNLWISLGSRDVRIRNKGFQKSREGSEDYNTNYIESEVEWLSQAHTQIRKQELLNEIQRSLDVADDLKAQARVQGVNDWKELIDRRNYAIWQPQEGSYFYSAMTVPDKLIQDIFAGKHTLQSAKAELIEVVAQGQRRPEWVVPREAAKLMNDFEVQPLENAISQITANAMASWKQWMLINPKNYASYNVRNFISDLDAAMPYPGIIKELPAAIKDIYKYSRNKGSAATPEIEQAIKDGVMDSGMTFAEIPDINKLGVFKVFADSESNVISKTLNTVWDSMKNTTNARENWIRLAAYRYMKKKIEAGETIYAASTASQINALRNDPGRQAAKLARELIGDYGGISEAGRTIRKHMIPFFSWMEVNAPRYVRMIKNMPAESASRPSLSGFTFGKGLKVAQGGTSLVAKMVAITAGINAWNHLMYPDLEDQFQKTDVGRRPHLIVGTYPDGSARVFQADTALRDALDWFNAGDLIADIEDLTKHRSSFGDKLAEGVKAPLERLVQGAAPQYKLPYELLTRESAYPSIFEKGTSFDLKTRPIRDRTEYLAQTLAVKGLYQRIMGRPAPPSSGPIGQVADWFITQRIDPEESIFWNVRSKVADYRKKSGKAGSGEDYTDRSNALFYFKQAIKWDNQLAADRYLKEYKDLGGTDAGLKQSLNRTHPLGGLAKNDWPEYVDKLTPEERDQLKIAIQYYDNKFKSGEVGTPAENTSKDGLMQMLFPGSTSQQIEQMQLIEKRKDEAAERKTERKAMRDAVTVPFGQ